MGHGVESNVSWGIRTNLAAKYKLPQIRASQEIALGMVFGIIGGGVWKAYHMSWKSQCDKLNDEWAKTKPWDSYPVKK